MKTPKKRPLMSSLLSKVNAPAGQEAAPPPPPPQNNQVTVAETPAPPKPSPASAAPSPAVRRKSPSRASQAPASSEKEGGKTQREAELIMNAKKSSRIVDFIHNKLKHISTDTGVPFSILVNRILNDYVSNHEGKKKPPLPRPY